VSKPENVLVPVEALPGIVQEAFTEAGWPCECWLEDNTPPVEELTQRADDIWENAIEPDEITPCPTCNALEAWWDMLGNQHCLRCDPPRRARRLADKAKRLRRRADRRQRLMRADHDEDEDKKPTEETSDTARPTPVASG
jgi:hypothetical protein